jgi:Leucine-rich repeat (LRR) protein
MDDCRIEDISALSELKKIKELFSNGNKIKNIEVINNWENIERIYMEGNVIVDVNSFAQLKKLEVVSLWDNEIEDIKALAENDGLQEGDLVGLYGNPIDCRKQADNIKILVERGVAVGIYCPNLGLIPGANKKGK